MTFADITAILEDIRYKDWRLQCGTDEHRQWLVARIPQPTGPDQVTRKWLISAYATKSEVVQTVLKMILTAEEHEAREAFKYKGAAIFGPHFDVESLRALCFTPCLDKRRRNLEHRYLAIGQRPISPSSVSLESGCLAGCGGLRDLVVDLEGNSVTRTLLWIVWWLTIACCLYMLVGFVMAYQNNVCIPGFSGCVEVKP